MTIFFEKPNISKFKDYQFKYNEHLLSVDGKGKISNFTGFGIFCIVDEIISALSTVFS